MNRRFWIIISYKCAFEFLMCIFGSFFLNQVFPSGYKVGMFHKFERAHWSGVAIEYYSFTILFKQYKPFQFYIVTSKIIIYNIKSIICIKNYFFNDLFLYVFLNLLLYFIFCLYLFKYNLINIKIIKNIINTSSTLTILGP